MEALHGVDVSWIHKPKDHEQRNRASSASSNPPQDPTKSRASGPAQASPRAVISPQTPVTNNSNSNRNSNGNGDSSKLSQFPGAVTPPSLSAPTRDATTAQPTPPTPPAPVSAGRQQQSKRPSLLSRGSSERINGDGKSMPRRSSWISNISNKFSSTSDPTPPLGANPPAAAGDDASPRPGQLREDEEDTPFAAASKGSSFFSSLTRKLSAGQTGSLPRVSGKGGVCQRRVLNVDPNRPRCLVPELDPARLRKVSFCVDVEIAGGPRYKDDEDDDQDRKQKKKEVKMKERAEGEALKHPEGQNEEKIAQDEAVGNGKTAPLPIPNSRSHSREVAKSRDRDDSISPPIGSVEASSSVDRKKEKKKRSEEERKERKEKRRRRAEENGSIPVEYSLDAGDSSPETVSSFLPGRSHASSRAADLNRPTTDPVRIYRRCCQLRETPILKRITEQLMSPTCCVPLEPGVVHCLDLTGSRLQLADMVTLGDWLAVVPVKKLLLEDADLGDEGLRCILAGLLAAKRPEPNKRGSTSPRHRMAFQSRPRPERSGIIERLRLKNNPRVTRIGWKHISLFLYACKSIKAIDLSMIQFPTTLPPSAQNSANASSSGPKLPNQETDAAETFLKCLSQRSGGSKLEELIMSECGMSAPQIRKIVDGAIMCGVSRLGFAGNQLDDEGLDSVLHFLRSGVCGALDIGGNDLRNKLGLIAEALASRTGDESYWGLSLAGCNLNTESVKPLFPALVNVPNFRFIDLSHNPDLCGKDNGTVSLLRRYIGQMKSLKRIHLSDVGMSAKQAIALADVLPEGPQLAHFNILENAQLSALASAKDEESQEEACALYASYMAAVRVSNTLICIDIDVPSPDNSEIVKALAKQVVAYSLRNMEHFAIVEVTGAPLANATADAAASLTAAHGGEQHLKEIAYPEVLMHLVGHMEGVAENHDNDDPAPDDDYIVGGTGVVKALQYVLGEKAEDVRRGSLANTTSNGSRTPRERPGSSAGVDEEQRGKAKKMSKNLLDSARKIRARLQPALQKVATAGDELAYRRLNFLDETLQSMIQRFEEEYPETRLVSPSPVPASLAMSGAEQAAAPLSVNTRGAKSDDEDEFDEGVRPAFSRHNSDVSLASRALSMEEGHLHRLGQRMRRSVVDSPVAAVEEDHSATEEVRMKALKEKLEGISGPELKTLVEHDGWDHALGQIGANMKDLRLLQEEDPQGWEQFKDSQLKARMNVSQDARMEALQ